MTKFLKEVKSYCDDHNKNAGGEFALNVHEDQGGVVYVYDGLVFVWLREIEDATMGQDNLEVIMDYNPQIPVERQLRGIEADINRHFLDLDKELDEALK